MSDNTIKYNGWRSTSRRGDDRDAKFSAGGGWNMMHGYNTSITLHRDNPNTGKPEVIELFLDEQAARSVHGMIERTFLDEGLCPLREKGKVIHHDSTCEFCAPRIKVREARWEKSVPVRAEREKKNRAD